MDVGKQFRDVPVIVMVVVSFSFTRNVPNCRARSITLSTSSIPASFSMRSGHIPLVMGSIVMFVVEENDLIIIVLLVILTLTSNVRRKEICKSFNILATTIHSSLLSIIQEYIEISHNVVRSVKSFLHLS